MAADVAQERNVFEPGQPVVVVGHDRAGRAVVEAQETGEDFADAGDILVDLIVRQELPGLVPTRGISHFGGASAHQHDRAVARLLQPPQHHDGDQASHVQAVRGGIKTDISGDDAGTRALIEAFGVGLLVDVSALGKAAQELGSKLGHDCCR